MQTPDTIKQFILAGRAVFTIDNGSGRHMTFKVSKKEPEPGSQYGPSWFVQHGAGRDGAYMGILSARTGKLKPTPKSRVLPGSRPWVVFEWLTDRIWHGKMLPAPATFNHAGKCGRCGLELTHPESIATGYGPDCMAILGITPPLPGVM